MTVHRFQPPSPKDTDTAGDHLSGGGGGGTLDGMSFVLDKLREHDARFERIENKLDRMDATLGSLHLWYVGTTAALVLAGLALVYAARQDTTATVATSLTAIQTILAAKPPEPTPDRPPTIIVVPPGSTVTPAPQK